MTIYAEEAGLHRRLILPVPVLTPRLSSYWIHLVTPVPASLARPLAEGLSNPVVCQEQRLATLIPATAARLPRSHPAGFAAPAPAPGGELLDRRRDNCRRPNGAFPAIRTGPAVRFFTMAGGCCWRPRRSGSGRRSPGSAALPAGTTPTGSGCCAGPSTGWSAVSACAAGGATSDQLQVGDALDFWRVALIEAPQRLLLVAEMKLPGKATLEFTLRPDARGTELRQIARFHPRGLAGLLYWWLVTPWHGLVFSGMLRGLADALGEAPLEGPERLSSGRGDET